VEQFVRSALTLQFEQPFRQDALSYLAWYGQWAGAEAAAGLSWLAFLMMGLAMLLALWRCQRTAAGFATAVALTYLAFFVFNKQAFANYYYFVIGALCCAIAAMAPVTTRAVPEAEVSAAAPRP
jgi:hypothetical protein